MRRVSTVGVLVSIGLALAVACGGGPTPPPDGGTPGPTHLGFTQQPAGASGGTALTRQPVVEIRDAAGLRTSSTAVVTLALQGGAAEAKVSETFSVAAVSGVATFTAVTIDRAAPGYTLTASATGAAAATS
jgi:hypothetical protein